MKQKTKWLRDYVSRKLLPDQSSHRVISNNMDINWHFINTASTSERIKLKNISQNSRYIWQLAQNQNTFGKYISSKTIMESWYKHPITAQIDYDLKDVISAKWEKTISSNAQKLYSTNSNYIWKDQSPGLLIVSNNAQEHLYDELKRLRKENKRLTEERDILKKAAAYFAKEI